MLKFIFKRCLEAVPTLFILITLSFFMMRLAPGNPFSDERNLSPEVMANIKAKYKLNDPLYKQYFNYLGQLLQGDLGPSFKYRDHTVNELVKTTFFVSLKLGVTAFLLALLLGISAGILAATRQNSYLDYSVMSFAMTGVVIPSFIVAPLLVLIFSVKFKLLPAGGWHNGAP